jgi:predicted metal-dependent hydrolase
MPNTLKKRKNSELGGAGKSAAAKRASRRRMGEFSDMTMLNFDERKVPLVFRENRRARRIIMRLDYGAASVVVVLPKRTSRQEGKRFALSNKDWIAERLDQLAEPIPFRHGAVVPFLGEPHRIRHRPTARGVVWCEEGEINVAGYEEHLPRRVHEWLKAEAKREIETRARDKAEAIGKKITKISIRDTKSRWGSCTDEGELAFSWRLILAPKYVLDYVVGHEVAHLKEMNHGPRFWKLCRELAPRSINLARDWLEAHGTELYRYGR